MIRAISRDGGLARLAPGQRTQLPVEIVTDDPAYERLLRLVLAVHMAMDPARLRPVFEAQVARDETMAEVVVGSGHVRHSLGLPDRVARRVRGIEQRIVLAAESGRLRLSDAGRGASRPVAALRSLQRPAGDYLRVLPLAAAPETPAAGKTAVSGKP